jgi:hypothetical protein
MEHLPDTPLERGENEVASFVSPEDLTARYDFNELDDATISLILIAEMTHISCSSLSHDKYAELLIERLTAPDDDPLKPHDISRDRLALMVTRGEEINEGAAKAHLLEDDVYRYILERIKASVRDREYSGYSRERKAAIKLMGLRAGQPLQRGGDVSSDNKWCEICDHLFRS